MEETENTGGIKRDEKGRILAADGWPISGCATFREGKSLSGLSISKLYNMANAGELETKQFGRSRRITWASLRKAFLSSEVAQ
jgi:hypothetical protein